MKQANKVFLTGSTGFVGKVVLEELIRRREELNLDKVYILIRKNKKKGGDPDKRFINEMAPSRCFSKLPSRLDKICSRGGR